jgi:hypothetical protein
MGLWWREYDFMKCLAWQKPSTLDEITLVIHWTMTIGQLSRPNVPYYVSICTCTVLHNLLRSSVAIVLANSKRQTVSVSKYIKAYWINYTFEKPQIGECIIKTFTNLLLK